MAPGGSKVPQTCPHTLPSLATCRISRREESRVLRVFFTPHWLELSPIFHFHLSDKEAAVSKVHGDEVGAQAC